MSLDTLQPGDELPAVSMRGLDRAMLAHYAGASGDYMPLHTDIDQARAAGLPDVIGHGMLVGAWMARVLTNAVSPSCIRSFSLRFVGITHLHNEIACTGKILSVNEKDGYRQLAVELRAVNQYGEVKATGNALIVLD